jgi:hypothetical protein
LIFGARDQHSNVLLLDFKKKNACLLNAWLKKFLKWNRVAVPKREAFEAELESIH